MLSLFKDQSAPLTNAEAKIQARNLLISSLNKGQVPAWEDYFQDLPVFESAEELESIKQSFQKLTEWNFLKDILGQEATEFFLHGTENSQVLKICGKKENIKFPLEKENWQLWLEIISIKFHQNWNVQNPFCSFYAHLFGKDYRLSLIHGSTSPGGISKLMLRCLSSIPHPLCSFGETDILKEFISQKKNILIAGSTGSGKTSLLSTLLELVDQDEHLIILEDTYEIMSSHSHQTRFLSGDTPQTSLKAYLSYSLRLSPDRIILGEMRSHEVVPFLMAMNTGHKGLMGTLHASSAHDALHRVALLFNLYSGEASLTFEKVMELLCRNIEYVVFMENKKVKEVIRILGSDKGVAFFETIAQSFAGQSEALKKTNLF